MVRSHTQELLSAPRLRRACDRCHAQKLRCIKPPRSDACLRCTKFCSSCVYSARTARRGPRKDVTDKSSDAISTSTSTAIVCSRVQNTIDKADRPDVICEGELWLDPSLLPRMPLEDPNCDLFNVGTITSDTFNSSQQTDWISGNNVLGSVLIPSGPFELANLNTKLVDHHANIASIVQVQSSFGSKVIAIDQTFSLTRQFTDIAKKFNLHTTDEATTHLFLSCYHRLLDIYGNLFEKMKICSQNPHAIVPAGITLKMPVTHVGSYIANDLWKTVEAAEAPMTTYATHFMLLLLLCTNLCEELRDAIASEHAQTRGGEAVCGSNGMALAQEIFHRDVRGLEMNSGKGHFNNDVKEAMWKRWNELEAQIQQTKKAAMVFAVACM